MIFPDQVNLIEIAYLQYQGDNELERQSRIVKGRELDAGYIDPSLATNIMESMIGGQSADFSGVNLISIANKTVRRRVSFNSVTAVNDEEQTKWFQNIIKYGRLMKVQRDLHRWAIRDGISFLIVDYDEATPRRWEEGGQGLPVFYPHEAFTSVEASWNGLIGSGEGCKAHWRNNDPNQTLQMVSKRWTETTYENGEAVTSQRMTLFIAKQPNTAARIEKYKLNDDGEWAQHTDTYIDENGTEQTETFPVWWTNDAGESGTSLPLPVVIFRNEDIEPSFNKAWGLQFGMDQVWGSFLSAINKAGHQALIALGFYPTSDGKQPTSDGSNLLKTTPRGWMGTPVTKDKADVKFIPAGSVQPIADGLDKASMFFALVAGLPLKNFTFSRQVSSSEALRHGEIELVAQANELMDLFQPTWEEVFEICRELDNLYGGSSWQPAEIQMNWEPVETVSGAIKTAEVAAKQAAGVPNVQIQRDTLGYSEEEIGTFGGNGEEEKQATEEA